MRTTISILTVFTLAGLPAFAQGPGDPYQPQGSIDVSNRFVRTGTRAEVTWDITYPLHVNDLVLPDPSGRVTTTEDVRVKIRVAGVAFQSGSTLLPVAFNARFGSGPWLQLFEGTSEAVQPSEYVFDQIVPAGTTIDFGAQGQRSSGSWYDPRTTAESNIAVTGLMNGDAPPHFAPAYEQGDIESFLTGLIGYSGDGPVVTVGPRDMVYLFELASNNPGDWWFDMQDVVAVVTYEQVTNGHGHAPSISQNNGLHRGNRNGDSRGPRRPVLATGFAPSSEPVPGDEVRD